MQPSLPKRGSEAPETEKAPAVLVKRIREAILEEVFQPGDRLREAELAEKFEVSRQPVREALVALEKEGTVIISPYKGAIVKPLSVAEVQDIAELRFALISLALKPAYRHLSPADFDHAYDLAKRITRSHNVKEHFEHHSQFWDGLFSKAQRPILRDVFRQLNDRPGGRFPFFRCWVLFAPRTTFCVSAQRLNSKSHFTVSTISLRAVTSSSPGPSMLA